MSNFRTERKVKVLRLNERHLMELFKAMSKGDVYIKKDGYITHITADLPIDFEFYETHFNPMGLYWEILVGSESFEPVTFGQISPELIATEVIETIKVINDE